MMLLLGSCIFLFLSLGPGFSGAIYVPGITPHEYDLDETVEVRAVKLSSSRTQLPYRYYELSFCAPDHIKEYAAQNIGEILRGDRMVSTPYKIKMGKDDACVVLCKQTDLTKSQVSTFRRFIADDYSVHLDIDNLIGATKHELDGGKGTRYSFGYKLGVVVNGVHYINNHLRFNLQYHTGNNGKYRLVGFEIEPMSLSEGDLSSTDSCQPPPLPIPIAHWKVINDQTKTIYFTYEVVWRPSTVRWASRWDIYLKSQGGQVHWFSIINSLVIVMFLATVIAMILVRTLRKDIAKYNRDDDAEDILEESGWKLVHGDVFRPPRHSRLLSALFGSGVQIFCMVFITIFFAMLGMLSPAARGAFMNAAILTYVFMGLFAGYYAGRLYRTMRGQLWKSTAVATGVLFPLLVLSIGSIVNIFVWYKGSSAAVPFTTIVVILALWLLVSLPLVFLGFFFGFRKRPYEMPVRTNQIPRAVPQPKFHQNLFVTTVLAGALPFGAVFIEVFFIYVALWESRFYYLFGFLFAVFLILIVCVAQVAIVLTYFQLCNEDYHWWWRTFVASGGPAVYLLFYSVCYYWTKLDITQFVPTVLYFGYTMLIVSTFWILTGTIGFVATFIFLRYIYSAIKID